jgi:hypothetical protein
MSVREWKFELIPLAGPTIEFYVHDNDAHELTAPPAIMTEHQAIERMKLIDSIADYLRETRMTKLEVSKVP